MNKTIKSGVLAAAFLVAGSGLAAELETDAQKLGYVFGMEIGAQLKQGGAEIDVDALCDGENVVIGGILELAGELRRELNRGVLVDPRFVEHSRHGHRHDRRRVHQVTQGAMAGAELRDEPRRQRR